MKQELIDKMKKTGRIQLTFLSYLDHYKLSIYFILIFLVRVIVILVKIKGGHSYNLTAHNVLTDPFFWCLLIGILFYFIQLPKLKFKIVETSLSRSKLLDIISKTVVDELEGILEINEGDLMIFKTIHLKIHTDGKIQERITIIYDNAVLSGPNRLLLHSMSIGQLKVYGLNKKNINTIIDKINNESL